MESRHLSSSNSLLGNKTADEETCSHFCFVPSHVFVVSDDLSSETKQHLVDSMVKLNHQDNNKILKDVYGADALLPTTAEMHIGDLVTCDFKKNVWRNTFIIQLGDCIASEVVT